MKPFGWDCTKLQIKTQEKLYQMDPSLEGLRELLFSLCNLEEDVDEVNPRGQHDVKVVQLRLALRTEAQEVERVEDAGVEVQGRVPDLDRIRSFRSLDQGIQRHP